MQWSVIVLVFGYISSVKTADELIAEYTKRLCEREPTCSLINHPSIPNDFRSLEKRNCLCDSQCQEYKDCCIDSKFYRVQDQLPPFFYYCSPNKKVYMKSRCLSEWTDSNMITKCQKSILPLEDDLSVITPLTNLITGITYGNVYCAVCNNAFNADNMNEFFTWTLTTRCGRLPFTHTPSSSPRNNQPAAPVGMNGKPPLLLQVPRLIPLDKNFEMTLKQLYPSLKNVDLPKSGYYLLVLLMYYIHPQTATIRMVRNVQRPIRIESDRDFTRKNISDFRWTRDKRKSNINVDFETFIEEWDAIALNASFDGELKMWLSHYKNKTYVCEFESKLPSSEDVPLRVCIPNVIAECSKFDNLVHTHQCRMQTQVVYDKYGFAYRNKECALCNGAREEDVFVCPYDESGRSIVIPDDSV